MPLYEALVRRAVEAREEAEATVRNSRRILALAENLREVAAGRGMLVRCAWCDSYQIGEEWLELRAINRGEQLVTGALRAQASHGICPTCFDAEMRFADEQRAASRLSETEHVLS